jgi:hypothetical protein
MPRIQITLVDGFLILKNLTHGKLAGKIKKKAPIVTMVYAPAVEDLNPVKAITNYVCNNIAKLKTNNATSVTLGEQRFPRRRK